MSVSGSTIGTTTLSHPSNSLHGLRRALNTANTGLKKDLRETRKGTRMMGILSRSECVGTNAGSMMARGEKCSTSMHLRLTDDRSI